MFFKIKNARNDVDDKIKSEPTHVDVEYDFEAPDVSGFRLPCLDTALFDQRMTKRTELLKSKITSGDLDTANTALVVASFSSLADELDATLLGYAARCQNEMLREIHEVNSAYEVAKEANAVGGSIVNRYGGVVVPFPVVK